MLYELLFCDAGHTAKVQSVKVNEDGFTRRHITNSNGNGYCIYGVWASRGWIPLSKVKRVRPKYFADSPASKLESQRRLSAE